MILAPFRKLLLELRNHRLDIVASHGSKNVASHYEVMAKMLERAISVAEAIDSPAMVKIPVIPLDQLIEYSTRQSVGPAGALAAGPMQVQEPVAFVLYAEDKRNVRIWFADRANSVKWAQANQIDPTMLVALYRAPVQPVAALDREIPTALRRWESRDMATQKHWSIGEFRQAEIDALRAAPSAPATVTNACEVGLTTLKDIWIAEGNDLEGFMRAKRGDAPAAGSTPITAKRPTDTEIIDFLQRSGSINYDFDSCSVQFEVPDEVDSGDLRDIVSLCIAAQEAS